ncbi:MAG: glutamate--tRNA ligase [Planctomycetes bacterium]|nr:glutamate--tRNA ligase [Planctomycetota bacterium]
MSEKTVTRFAPSPTGYLHVGGARTALFNWLYAKKTGGIFILRIEDTDLSRNTPTAMQQVMADLKWLGIDWDEGPGVEGPNGPYLQSQRRDIYDKYLKQLLEEKKAYYCFDTPEEVQVLRDKAAAEKKNFTYPRPENFPDESDAEKAKAQGKPVTVRFAVPNDKPIVVNDIVRGEVTFAASEIGDFVIQKRDGFPTYHFACVVDDELMGVTHVIRGQEHLMNTPGHQVLQAALGFRTPVYAHMSVTVSEGGGKLSKRERGKRLRREIIDNPSAYLLDAIKTEPEQFERFLDDNATPKDSSLINKWAEELGVDSTIIATAAAKNGGGNRSLRNEMINKSEAALAHKIGSTPSEVKKFKEGKVAFDEPIIIGEAEYLDLDLPEINVVDFLRGGYLPETMVNFLALLGWSPGGDREIMSRDELISSFDISRLAKSNSLFDRKKLISFNVEHLKLVDKEKLLSHFKDYIKIIDSPVLKADDALLSTLIKICEGARTLEDIEKKSRFFFSDSDNIEYDPKAVKKVLLKEGALDILHVIRGKLADMEPFTEEALEAMLRALAEEKEVGLGKVAQPLRVAISGTMVSPPIFDSVKILGKENTLARIDNTIEKFKS